MPRMNQDVREEAHVENKIYKKAMVGVTFSANLKTDPRPKNEVAGWYESKRRTRTIKESIRQSIQVERKAWKMGCVE
jgi:hypothetical protein